MPDSQFYTGRGDDGYTGLLGPERVPKYDPRPEAYGTVDEAQAALGLARAAGCLPRTGKVLLSIQRDLYSLMGELAAGAESLPANRLTSSHVDQLEAWISEAEIAVDMPREFVVPGDSLAGAALHLARTIVRRAERLVVRLASEGDLSNRHVVRYLNRLSSLLFALACLEDQVSTGAGPTLAKRAI
jgi:cob(I)alamin adenosyltransferase